MIGVIANNCILFKQQRKHPISKGECDVVNFGASKIDIKDKQLAVDCAHLANYAYPSQKSTKLPNGYEDITAEFSNVDLGKVKASKNYIFFSISCREKDVQIVERILRQGGYLE